MNGNVTTTPKGKQAPEAPETSVQVVCEVLANGLLYQDAHHAIGKQLTMSEAAAAVFTKMDPPQLKVVGVA